VGECDFDEFCDGVDADCPTNAGDPLGTSCTSDGLECTTDQCNGAGACTHPGSPLGTSCTTDGLECTTDQCDGSGACTHPGKPLGTSCTGDGQECTDDQCDGSGTCTHPGKPFGTACTTDGQECTLDQCDGSGACTHPGSPLGTACTSDSNSCTDDQCDGTGLCAHPANTAPCDDEDECSGPDACSGGQCVGGPTLDCDDGDLCTIDSCDSGFGCQNAAEPRPAGACVLAATNRLRISYDDDPERYRLDWKWSSGEGFDQAQLGTPDVTTAYALCIYDVMAGLPTLATSVDVGPGALWQSRDPRGWNYRDRSAAFDGILKVRLKTGVDGKTKAQMKGSGASLPLPAPSGAASYFEQNPSVVVQLQNSVGTCWSSEFPAAGTSSNTPTRFDASAP